MAITWVSIHLLPKVAAKGGSTVVDTLNQLPDLRIPVTRLSLGHNHVRCAGSHQHSE
jgi:hypothetical protein